jgi:protein tyrosine phosphatase (PTP) superfamily phosphohydrolase (DUF442 family)
MDDKKRKKYIIVTVCVVAFSWLFYEEVIEEYVIPNLFPLRWGCTEEGVVYRSGQISVRLVEKTMKENDIKVVVALNGDYPDDPRQKAEKAAVEKLGLEFHRFVLKGNGTGNVAKYAQAIEVIVRAKEEGKRILVHCAAGQMRTGGVLSCYQLLVNGVSPDEIVPELKRYGYDPGHDVALVPFMNDNMEELAGLLKEMEVIDEIPNPLPRI